MRSSFIISIAVGASLVAAAPSRWPHAVKRASVNTTTSPSFPTGSSSNNSKFTYPLSNGFPTYEDVTDIEKIAGGSLSNAPGPASVQDSTLAALRLIAFNELSEVAFFTELLQNITNEVPGYESLNGFSKDYLVSIFEAIQAQEELHVLNANIALASLDTRNITGPIQACKYQFPVQSLSEAIVLANTFTDVVLGTLADTQTALAKSNDIGLISGLGSVIGQEGEQNGFFRLFEQRRPSAQPFLTISAPQFAFSALNQMFVSDCPQDITSFGLGEPFGALTVLNSTILPGDQTLTFEATAAAGSNITSLEGLELVYINGVNLPIVEQITNVQPVGNGTWRFDAFFPQQSRIMSGLTIAAVTSTADFSAASVDDVAAHTVFAPGLIEVF